MSPEIITSTANPRVKALLALRDRRGRQASGTYLVEGGRELERALAAEVPFRSVVVCEALLGEPERRLADRLQAAGAAPLALGEAAFRRVAYRRHPPGVIGVAVTTARSLDDIPLSAEPLVLIVDGIEKPGNLGAMLRTADAAGADGVIVAGTDVDAGNPNVIRASQGAVFSVPLAAAPVDAIIRWSAAAGLGLIAGSPAAAESYWEAPLTPATGIVVGSEASGLSAGWEGAVRTVRIPMAGTSDSLNAATAAALLLYEALRRREGG